MDDIPLLVDHFIGEASQVLGKEKAMVSTEFLSVLSKYDFPGNIRELRGIIFDTMSSQESPLLSAESIKEMLGLTADSCAAGNDTGISAGVESFKHSADLPTIQQAVQSLIQEALSRSKGNQKIAAKLLGISPISGQVL